MKEFHHWACVMFRHISFVLLLFILFFACSCRTLDGRVAHSPGEAEFGGGWPLSPVVRMSSSSDYVSEYGKGSKLVRQYVALYSDGDLSDAQWSRGLSLLTKALSLPDLSDGVRMKLSDLVLRHELLWMMNKTYHQTGGVGAVDKESFLTGLSMSRRLVEYRKEHAISGLDSLRDYERRCGDPLGVEWLSLFDGYDVLSGVDDRWRLVLRSRGEGCVTLAVEVGYGLPYPAQMAGWGQVELYVDTELPGGGIADVRVNFRGLPSEVSVKVDGHDLELIRSGSACQALIPRGLMRKDVRQRLSIELNENGIGAERIFRQPWFVVASHQG